LQLVSATSIGSGVSSVTVTSVFSSTYDNYMVIITGGTSSTSFAIRLQMNTSTGSTYFIAGTYGNFGVNSGVTYNPAAATNWSDAILGGTSGYSAVITINGPFASRPTYGFTNTANNASYYDFSLLETSTNSNTGFTLTPAAGTLTGGTIYVYGYIK
jgi:hypothetical protein